MTSKLWISVVLAITVTGLPLASFAQYGNYWGGEGGGSSTTTTTGGGDGSTGTNATGNTDTDLETTIGLPPTSTDTGTNEDYSWIPPRKADINVEIGITPYTVVRLPRGYERVQLRIDALLFRVANMPAAERQVKAIQLANAIQNIKQTALWNNPRIRLLLQYLQDRLVMIITLPL